MFMNSFFSFTIHISRVSLNHVISLSITSSKGSLFSMLRFFFGVELGPVFLLQFTTPTNVLVFNFVGPYRSAYPRLPFVGLV